VEIAMAIKAGLGEAGWPVFEKWSQPGSTYNARTCRTTWNSIKADGSVTYGTLVHHARAGGWRPSNLRHSGSTTRRVREDAGGRGPGPAPDAKPPTTKVARAILAVAMPADGTSARSYLATRGTWPTADKALPPATRWLPVRAVADLPTWAKDDGKTRRLVLPAGAAGALVFALACPGAAPDAVALEAVTADGRRLPWSDRADDTKRSYGPKGGRVFEIVASTGNPWPDTNAAPLVVAVVEGAADALAVARLRLPGVLVRAAMTIPRAALVADLPLVVAVCLAADADREGRKSGVQMHRDLTAAGRTCYVAVLRGGDPDELLRGADDANLAEYHNKRAGILVDDGLDRPMATARALHDLFCRLEMHHD